MTRTRRAVARAPTTTKAVVGTGYSVLKDQQIAYERDVRVIAPGQVALLLKPQGSGQWQQHAIDMETQAAWFATLLNGVSIPQNVLSQLNGSAIGGTATGTTRVTGRRVT